MSDTFRLTNDASCPVLVCEPLEDAGFINAFSTRKGGTSKLPKDDLNLSYREDDAGAVDENRRRFLEAAQIDYPIVTCLQTHSDKRFFVEEAFSGLDPEADALLASRMEVMLGIQTADCLPVLIGDPKSLLFAGVHAGWRGTVNRIVQKTIRDLISKGANAERLVAALGPSACGRCYEVGQDVFDKFKASVTDTSTFLVPKGEKFMLDTAEANRLQLLELGVLPSNIYVSNFCTMHNNDLFFSYRKESNGGKKIVGRMLSVIGRQ